MFNSKFVSYKKFKKDFTFCSFTNIFFILSNDFWMEMGIIFAQIIKMRINKFLNVFIKSHLTISFYKSKF